MPTLLDAPGMTFGIRVSGSPQAVLVDNKVGGIQGVHAEDPQDLGKCSDHAAMPAGGAVAVAIQNSPGTQVDGLAIGSIHGGNGAIAIGILNDQMDDEAPASAVGLAVISSPGTLLEHVQVDDVRGGNGFSATWWFTSTQLDASEKGASGAAVVVTSGGVKLRHLRVYDVGAGTTPDGIAPVPVTLVGADATSYTTVQFATLQSVNATAVSGPIDLRDSLVFGAGACTSGPVTTAYTTFFQCSGAPACATCSSIDPQFVDPDAGNLHLKATSPGIDAADPKQPWCLEPAPNGCRADRGAYGNTSEATAKPGAPQCMCVP
jgi:hypothetical protein